MTRSVIQLRALLKVPELGRINFREVFGLSFSELLDHWRGGHLPIPRKVVHAISFDDVVVSQGGDYAEVIDTRYKVTHGVDFVAYKHTYDTSAGISGFEPAQGHFFGYDHPRWIEPHVYAVADHGTGASHLALSEPNAINVNGETGLVSGQCLRNDDAIRINFDPPACVVKIDTQCRYLQSDDPQVTGNWPMLLAFDAAGNLLDQVQAPFSAGSPTTLCVSSWADDIAYVMVTVNNHYQGDGPVAIFDNLAWTTIEFVLQSLKTLRDTPPPVARGALVDLVVNRIHALQLTQQRLQERLAQVADGELSAQLQADTAALIKQTDALMTAYRKITADTANRSSASEGPSA